MFDELDCLREVPELRRLLGHYAEAGAADREAWQDRLMELQGVEARELVRLHGLLLAFGWAEQNTGHTPACRPGAVPACYRATASGIRALKVSLAGPAGWDPEVPSVSGGTAGASHGDGAEPPTPHRRPRQKASPARPVPAEAEGVAVPADAPGGLVTTFVG